MYRIVEKYNRYGNSEFEIQKQVVKREYIFFGKEYLDWEPLVVSKYENYVNNQYKFQKYKQVYGNLYSAKKFLSMYEKFLNMNPFEYRGEKLIPILYQGNFETRITYYDPKSYYRRSDYDYGYKLYNIEDFKKMVDNKLDNGKVIKIHNV